MKRMAVVVSEQSTLEQVERYLPANYEAAEVGGLIVIAGDDNHGWTLDGYVLPRLASGLHVAREVHVTQVG